MRFSRFLAFFRVPILALLVLYLFIVLPAAGQEDGTPAAQQALDWKAIAGNTMLTVLQVLGTGIATLLGAAMLWVCRAIAGTFNIQMSAAQDAQVYAAADKAVAYAEEWARNHALNPTGSDKSDVALQAMREVLDSKTYRDFGEPAIRKLLDAALLKLRVQESAAAATPVRSE